jgi:ComF family protein
VDPCERCRGIETSLDGTLSVAMFDDIAREAVHALKYHGHHAIASTMGRVMAAQAQDQAGTLVTPVSLHPRRRRERGYDQAAMLSRVVACSLDMPCDEVLRRVRYTPQQVSLDGEARRRNVAGAFEACCELAGEHVILIDDVLTTGATMEAAAATLKAAGAERVIGLVFAHAVAEDRTAEIFDS